MLKLAYASAAHGSLPSQMATVITQDWQVAQLRWEEVSRLSALPDLLWLDLGSQVTPRSAPWDTFRNLAALQPRTDRHAMIFISGAAPSDDDHWKIVGQTFAAFPAPERVEIDMKGEPDVAAALAKCSALFLRYAQGSHLATTAVRPFTAVPDADLRNEDGNLSVKKIAAAFRIDVAELGRWIGRKKAALSKSPAADSLQPLLEPYAEIARVRGALDGGDVAFRQWLRTRHPLLQNESPLHWCEQGKAREVAEFVQDALTGQPT